MTFQRVFSGAIWEERVGYCRVLKAGSLVFVTGTAVVGPATKNTSGQLTHAYADADTDGVPIGLANTLTTRVGTGMLTITLRRVGDKSASTIDQVREGGVNSIGGTSRISATFQVQVL